jgi:preprotein translocase subunit SecG
MNTILMIILCLVIALVLVIVAVTLALNTKSEGLGAAITGASDSYRGAVGVEEQKRRLLGQLCWSFLILAFIYSLIEAFIP